MKVDVYIPVYNPGEKFLSLLNMLKRQKGIAFTVHVIDSAAMGPEYRYALKGLESATYRQIPASLFNHGGTRQRCLEENPNSDICIFLTQDAVPADEYAIANLLKIFADPMIGCAYGRQLPYKDATPIAEFARCFNYKEISYTYCFSDRLEHGIKTAFCSDSFAAYRYSAMKAVGGFPLNVILSEDMYVAAKMLMAGWKVSYRADAQVYHSHNYTILEEFKRYFDIGAFQRRESWIRRTFGKAEGEGKKFVCKEIKFLFARYPYLIPALIVRNIMKYLAYRLGLKEELIPKSIKKRISMNPSYW